MEVWVTGVVIGAGVDVVSTIWLGWQPPLQDVMVMVLVVKVVAM